MGAWCGRNMNPSTIGALLPDLVAACESGSYSQLLSYLALAIALMPVLFTWPWVTFARWVRQQPWWPQAYPPMVAMMVNFGFPAKPGIDPKFPDGVDQEYASGSYAYTCALALHHTLCALLMLPVVLHGWSDRHEQNLFVYGALLCVTYDVYDMLANAVKAFTSFGWILCDGCAVTTKEYCVLFSIHHATSMLVVLPFSLHMPGDTDYHLAAFSLLAAAGVCYGTGQYKLTLNVKTKSGLNCVKAIAIVQFVCIAYTRLYLWCPCAYRLLSRVWLVAPMHPELYGAFLAVAFMSLFNLILVFDSVSGLLKWLPKTVQPAKTA